MKKTMRESGMSLIELMVTLVVLAIFIVAAAPYVGDTIKNGRIRSLTEAIAGGMKQAQVEAIKHNTPMIFSLNSDYSGWTIQQVNDDGTTTAFKQLDWTDQKLTSGGISYTVMPAGASSLTFSGMGRIIANPSGTGGSSSPSITQVDTTGGDLSNAIYNLRIEADMARGVRVCLPYLNNPNDPQACL